MIDVASHDQWAHGIPHDQFAWLREHAPVFRHPSTEEGLPDFFWAFTLHEDVQQASRDWEAFSSQHQGNILHSDGTSDEFRTIISTDPPDHSRLRRLVNRGFTPRMVKQFEDHYRDVTRTILDHALADGTFDFVVEVAAELPLVAIAELLGVPFEDRHKIMDWTNRMVGGTDPEYFETEERRVGAAAELYLYAQGLGDQRRAEPRDDIITKLVTEVDGDALGAHEFELFILALSVGGNETTRNAISHSMLALIENPEQMDLLRTDTEAVIDTAVEEMLRWSTPVTVFKREATADMEVRGQRIAKGDAVALYYLSANRDERAFADPHSFDLTRTPNDHVSFGGGGPHFCLGATLARLEMKIMFEELLDRTDDIRLAGEPDRLRSGFINGIKHLPVAVS